MSDLSSTSYCRDNKEDNCMSPMFMILLLLCLGGGDNGLLGGSCGNNSCGCNNGMGSLLPIILMLTLCGGSF